MTISIKRLWNRQNVPSNLLRRHLILRRLHWSFSKTGQYKCLRRRLNWTMKNLYFQVTYLKLFWALDNRLSLLVDTGRFCCWEGLPDWDWEDCEGIWSILDKASLRISFTTFTSSIFRSTGNTWACAVRLSCLWCPGLLLFLIPRATRLYL